MSWVYDDVLTTRNGEAGMNIHTCTADDPWTEQKSDRAQHPDAKLVYDGGWEQEYERYECPHCGLRFKVTLPSH